VKELLNYNFDPAHVRDGDFDALYRSRRRDSLFAFAYEDVDGSIVALRDHLGSVPLFYRQGAGGVRFSLRVADLIEPGDRLEPYGTDVFLAFGTTKLESLVRGIVPVRPGSVLRFRAPGAEPEVAFEHRIDPGPPLSLSATDEVDELDRLMRQAIARTLKSEDVGIYMSGGIDSALMAIYLKKAGARVSAYTSAPWGTASREVPFAKISAERTGVDDHVIVPLETESYGRLVAASRELYVNPLGQSTMIGVTSLWDGTSIGDRPQVYLGQNTDTMTCSVTQQNLVYFLHRLPRAAKRRIDRRLGHDGALAEYLSLYTHGQITGYEPFERAYPGVGPLRVLTLAGMLVVHSPVDGECLSSPVVRRGHLAANPYCDMDMVEFCMRIPVRHRIDFSRSSRIRIRLDKRVFRRLAERYLPGELVHRKKAFTVPLGRDDATRNFDDSLPSTFAGRRLVSSQERFAAGVLAPFAEEHRLEGLGAAGTGASALAG
jgi:asparagine synthetase B (glutamine-hydrolysing)